MRQTIKSGGIAHRNWVYLRDKVIGGLQYSYTWDNSNPGFITISIDEDVSLATNMNAKGKEITRGTYITAEEFVEATSHEVLKDLVHNILDSSIEFRLADSNIGEIVSNCINSFMWSGARGADRGRSWLCVKRRIETYLRGYIPSCTM